MPPVAFPFTAARVAAFAENCLPSAHTIEERFESDIGSAVSSVVSGIVDTAKIVAAVMTGNSTALSNALTGMVKGNGGAAGELGAILTAVPKTVITDLVSWVTGKMASTAAAVGKGGGSATPGVVTVAK